MCSYFVWVYEVVCNSVFASFSVHLGPNLPSFAGKDYLALGCVHWVWLFLVCGQIICQFDFYCAVVSSVLFFFYNFLVCLFYFVSLTQLAF